VVEHVAAAVAEALVTEVVTAADVVASTVEAEEVVVTAAVET
jgi:hypothetical protein